MDSKNLTLAHKIIINFGHKGVKMSTAITTVREIPNRHEKDSYACAAYLSQYIEKCRTTISVKVAFVAKLRPAKQQHPETHGTFKGKIELYKYLKDMYLPKSSAQKHQTFHQLQQEEEIPTPEVANNYLSVEILLLIKDQMSKGHAIP